MVRAVRFGRALAERGQRDGRVGKHHDVPALSRFFPHEMHSVWTPAPPRPPKTVLSVVIWMAATWGLACPFPPLGGHAGGGDLDEVLGHPAAREDGRRVQHGRDVAAQGDLVVAKEAFLPFDK